MRQQTGTMAKALGHQVDFATRCSAGATTELLLLLLCSLSLAHFVAVPAVSLAINSTSLRGCRAGRCAAGVRGAGGLGRDTVGQQSARAPGWPSAAPHWLPWPHPCINLCLLLVGWSGLVQPYALSTPPPPGSLPSHLC